MHPPETPTAFEYKDSFQFIGWFVPVGSEPTLALKMKTCKKEVVWFPKFVTVQRKDVMEVTRYVLVAVHGVKTEKPVHSQCEANGPDGLPEGQNDEKMPMEALCAPSAVAKAFESLV